MNIIDQIIQNPEGTVIAKSKIQKICLDKLKESPVPNKKSEIWRLTNKTKFERFLNYQLSNEFYNPKIPKDFKKQNSLRLIIGAENKLNIENSKWKIKELTEEEINNLIQKKLLESDANINWSNLFNQYSSNKNNVLGLHIAGQEIPPLEILSNSMNNFLSAKTLILNIEKESKVDILTINLGDENSALSSSSYLFIGENALVNHGLISKGKKKSNLINSLNIFQQPKSEYNLGSLQYNFDFARLEININQIQGRAKTNIKGMQLSSNNEQISTHAKIEFNGPEGFLDQLNKSLAKDKSHAIFDGLILVPQAAQKTDASQLSRNLLLSNFAKIDTKPQLEIVADDVKCKHGATISQLNENELFYMRSRGLTLEEASKLQLRSYYQEIISFMPISEEKWNLIDLILQNK